jgi:hypothetical protein
VAQLQLAELPARVDAIWASPPCTQYSIARTKAKTPRDFASADALVRKTLEIVDAFPGVPFFIENPASGYLRTRPVMAGRPYRAISYCKYADHRFPKYRKHTAIWTNADWWTHRPPCRLGDRCAWCDASGRHPEYAQRWRVQRGGRLVPGSPLETLYGVPPALAEEILAQRPRVETPDTP